MQLLFKEVLSACRLPVSFPSVDSFCLFVYLYLVVLHLLLLLSGCCCCCCCCCCCVCVSHLLLMGFLLLLLIIVAATAAAAAEAVAAMSMCICAYVCFAVVCSCALLDLDSEGQDTLKRSSLGCLFSPQCMVAGKEDGGCLFPRGRRLGSSDPVRSQAQDVLRRQLEASDTPGGKS